MKDAPLSATRPRQVVAVDVHELRTKEGPAFLFIAVDAFSQVVMAFDAKPQAAVPDYIAFIERLDAQHDLRSGTTLVCDLPALHRAELVRNFPFFHKVVCDKRKANAITREFRGYVQQQLGQ